MNGRPDIRAHRFEVYECGNVDCGLHFIMYGSDNALLCELVISQEGTLSLIKALQSFLYDRATRKI